MNETTPSSLPQEQETTPIPPTDTTMDASTPDRPTKPKKSKKLLLILAAAAIVVIVVALVLLSSSGGSSSSSDTETLFTSGLVAAQTGDQWGYIDKTGKYIINPQFDYANKFAANGLARVLSGGKIGYIDKTGKYVINPQFDYAYSFVDGVAVVSVGGKYGVIDAKGSYLANPQYEDLSASYSSGMAWFADEDEKIGYLNTKGEVAISAQYDYIYHSKYWGYAGDFYADGYAVVRVGDRYGIIDKTGSYIVNPQFDGIFS